MATGLKPYLSVEPLPSREPGKAKLPLLDRSIRGREPFSSGQWRIRGQGPLLQAAGEVSSLDVPESPFIPWGRPPPPSSRASPDPALLLEICPPAPSNFSRQNISVSEGSDKTLFARWRKKRGRIKTQVPFISTTTWPFCNCYVSLGRGLIQGP